MYPWEYTNPTPDASADVEYSVKHKPKREPLTRLDNDFPPYRKKGIIE
jgi:hypothetical protein